MLLEHRVLEPRARSTQPPLLVLLHGIGADEADLLALAPLLDPRFLVVSARAPHPAEPMGYRWYAIDWSSTPARADPAEMVATRDLLGRCIEEATAAYGTDPSRVFLFGFSQGAIMSLALLVARPELVRGVVAHSGRLSRLPGPELSAETLAHAHVLILHGAQDPVIPASEGGKAHDVLAPFMGVRVAYRAFQELGHGISEASLAEAASWLTARLGRAPAGERAASSR